MPQGSHKGKHLSCVNIKLDKTLPHFQHQHAQLQPPLLYHPHHPPLKYFCDHIHNVSRSAKCKEYTIKR